MIIIMPFGNEYQLNRTRNLFIFFVHLIGERLVEATLRRTKQDFAHCMQWSVDVAHPEAKCIQVVMDNLNTKTCVAL